MRHRDKRYATATRVLSHFDMDRSSSHSTALTASNHKEEDETTYKDGFKVVYQKSLMELDEAIASVRYLCKFQHEHEWSSASPNLLPTCNDSANDYGKQSLAGSANTDSDIDANTEVEKHVVGSLLIQQSVASHSMRSSIKSKFHDRSDCSVDGLSSKRSTRSIRFHDNNQLSSMDVTSDGRSVFSRRSCSSSSAWSSSKSHSSTRSTRSSRSVRSQRRKELELIRTVRSTLLEKLKASNSNTSISTRTGEKDMPNQYSTSGILLDLEEFIPNLLAEELNRLSLHPDKQDVNTSTGHNDLVDSEGSNASIPPLQSVSGDVDPSRVHDDTYVMQKHPMNMLPPLLESIDDDAAWLQSRAEEPIWVDINVTQKTSASITKTNPFVSDDKNCNLWPNSSFKDEWEFDEMVFPTTNTCSTADVTSTSAVQVETKTNPFDAPSFERSKSSSSKTNLNKSDNLKHSGSPQSVTQPPYHVASSSSTKKSLPIPPLGIDSLYSPPASFLLPESAWVRRLNHCRRDRMNLQ